MNSDVFIIGEVWGALLFGVFFPPHLFLQSLKWLTAFFHCINLFFIHFSDVYRNASGMLPNHQRKFAKNEQKEKKRGVGGDVKKPRSPEKATKYWSSQDPKQFPALPQTSSLTLGKSHQSTNSVIPWIALIPFYHTTCLPQERNQNSWGKKSRELTHIQGSVGNTIYLSCEHAPQITTSKWKSLAFVS